MEYWSYHPRWRVPSKSNLVAELDHARFCAFHGH
jgi:hypothetical protein